MARPVAGPGASASTCYPAVAAVMGTGAVIPGHAGVANAVGAVVGNVRVFARASVPQPEQGVFQVFGAGMTERFTELDKAFAHVEGIPRSRAHRKAVEAGAGEIRIRIDRKDRMAGIGGQHVLIESVVTATASGRPRVAV